jgi:hypothetical protein
MLTLAEPMSGLKATLKRLSKDNEQEASALIQFRKFRNDHNLRSGADFETARAMPAWQWWELYQSMFPDLAPIAIRVLAQVVSATACERNWSTFGLLHTASRNRMLPKTAADLTFVCSSLRLRDQLAEDGHGDQFTEWENDERNDESCADEDSG